jgi:transposase
VSHELIKRLVEITDTLVLRIEKLEQENRALKEQLIELLETTLTGL